MIIGHEWRDLLAGRWQAFALIMLGMWLMAADSLVTATIMPSVGAGLGGYAWFGWATSGYLIGLVVAGACAGWLSDRFGLRGVMAASGVILAAGCWLSAAAPSMLAFVVGRTVQGIAAGWVSGFCYVMISMVFPERHLPRVFAAATSVWGIATLLGPLVGGAFADAGNWRGVFHMFAGQALLFAVAALWLVPRAAPPDAPARVPVRPLLLLTLAVVLMSSAGVTANVTLALVLVPAGLALLWAAILVDRREPAGLLPKAGSRLNTALGSAYAAFFCATAAAVGFSVYGPAILQFTNGLSALEAGYVIAVEALAWTGVALLVAGAREVWIHRFIVAGIALIAIATALLVGVMASGNLALVLIAGALLGGGFGMSFAFISRDIMVSLSDDDRAIGSGAINAVRNAGGAAGAAIASVAANLTGFAHGLTPANVASASFWIFATALPLALAAVVFAVRLVRLMAASTPAAPDGSSRGI